MYNILLCYNQNVLCVVIKFKCAASITVLALTGAAHEIALAAHLKDLVSSSLARKASAWVNCRLYSSTTTYSSGCLPLSVK